MKLLYILITNLFLCSVLNANNQNELFDALSTLQQKMSALGNTLMKKPVQPQKKLPKKTKGSPEPTQYQKEMSEWTKQSKIINDIAEEFNKKPDELGAILVKNITEGKEIMVGNKVVDLDEYLSYQKKYFQNIFPTLEEALKELNAITIKPPNLSVFPNIVAITGNSSYLKLLFSQLGSAYKDVLDEETLNLLHSLEKLVGGFSEKWEKMKVKFGNKFAAKV